MPPTPLIGRALCEPRLGVAYSSYAPRGRSACYASAYKNHSDENKSI